MKQAFVIIRVSSQDQLKGYGQDVQWGSDIIPNAPHLDLEVSEKYRRNIQESATGWERVKFESALHEAIEYFKSGEVQALLFPRVDRETRFIWSSLPLLVEVLKSGLPVFFAREKFELNPNDPDSTQKYLQKAIASQEYIATMKVNMMEGLRRKAEKGLFPSGRRARLYGYSYVSGKGPGQGIRIINKEESKVVKEIFDLYVNGGLTVYKIACELNGRGLPSPSGVKWSGQGVWEVLNHEAYTGKTYAFQYKGDKLAPREDWIELPNATPPIISRELYEAAQIKMKRNTKFSLRNTKRDYLLSGRITCQKCGKPYWVGYARSYRYYRCASNRIYLGNSRCGNKHYRVEGLDASVWDAIKEALDNPQKLNDRIDSLRQNRPTVEYTEELASLEKKLVDLEKDQHKLLQLALKGFPEQVILTENERINGIRAYMKKRQEELKYSIIKSQQDSEDLRNIEKVLDILRESSNNLSYQGKLDIINLLKIEVFIDGENIRVKGTITPGSIKLTPLQSYLSNVNAFQFEIYIKP